nr:cation-translocating P-type ATPase [Hoyosella rhizosphaerae]
MIVGPADGEMIVGPADGVEVISIAAGRLRVRVPWMVRSPARAVAIENAVEVVHGVRAVHAYPKTGSVVVWYSTNRVEPLDIVQVITSIDEVSRAAVPSREPYSAEVSTGDLARMVIGGSALFLLGFRRYVLRRPPVLGPTSRLFATGVTIITGYPFLKGAVRSLTKSKVGGTDTLVSAATVASLLLRENVVALTVLWLLNIGEYLQELTLRRTRRAISDLLSGAQDTVFLRTADGSEVKVDIDTVRVGDYVVIHEHVALPVDGVIVDGDGIIDQSAITGEPLPVTVTAGEKVHAGSVLMRGKIVVEAQAVGKDTAIGRIISRVEQAQSDRAPIQTVGENFSRRFVPASFFLAGATLLLTRDVRRAMTMLLIACPCAVGLSTPTAISAAIGNGARRGILIKGGSHLELAGRVDVMVFDKTGTLTVGRPVVTNMVSFHPEWDPSSVLAYAASSEIHSRHPLAQAVIRSTEERRILIPPHEQCEVLVGLGMRTWADGRTLLLGSPALLESEGVDVSGEAADWVAKLRRKSETPLLLSVDGELVGLVSLRDEVRPEAPGVLEVLRASGVSRFIMLTGDHPETAAAVAQELGITEWKAEVLPDEKLDLIESLQRAGHTVAMVGDGTNDAPALAGANIGIAMGISGTDVAVETADIALATDDLRRLQDLRELGAHTVDVIRQNYGMSITVNAAGLLMSAVGALSPVLAAILHNASSVAVVANSSRLIQYRLDVAPAPRRLDQQEHHRDEERSGKD